MLSDADLIKQFDKHRQIDEAGLALQHQRAKIEHSAVAGHIDNAEKWQKDIVNKISPFVDSVQGTMIQIRRKPEYSARLLDNVSQQAVSDYMNACSDWARDTANMDKLETQQDRELLICGYGMLDTNISYQNNPDGELEGELVRYDEAWWDPQAKEINCTDARWMRRVKAFTKDDVETLWKTDDVEEFETYTSNLSNPQYNPGGGEYDMVQWGGNPGETDLVQVHFYQWWSLENYWRGANPVKLIQDPQQQQDFVQRLQIITQMRKEDASADEQEDMFELDPSADYLSMTPEQKSDVAALCKEYGLDAWRPIAQKRKTFYTALLSGKVVIKKFKSPVQDGFTLKMKTGKYDPNTRTWYGMVRALISPSEYANKALSETMRVIASNSKGGVMYEESAVDDAEEFEKNYAKTDAAIQVSDGALSGGKIQPKAVASMPNGYENIYTVMDNSMSDVAGVSKEFIGTSQNKQVAALLESQRINQVLAVLAIYFDAIDMYQREHARMMITYLRMLAQNSQGRLIRIVGQNGMKAYAELDESRLNVEYDLEIGESPTTPAQKERNAEIMLQMAQTLAPMGVNIYPQVVQLLPISASVKQELSQALQPKPAAPPSPLQQKQAMQQVDLQDAIIADTKVDAMLKHAKALQIDVQNQKTKVDMQKTHADTVNTVANTEQTMLENKNFDRLAAGGTTAVSI